MKKELVVIYKNNEDKITGLKIGENVIEGTFEEAKEKLMKTLGDKLIFCYMKEVEE